MGDNHDDRCWVGFDLGGTKMMAAVFDAEFKLLGRKRRKTKGNEGSKAGVERIAETIDNALEDASVTRDRIAGIGVGAPGLVDLDQGVVVECSNLGWKNVNLKNDLARRFGCPVTVLNDVDAGVYGEYRFGAAKNARCAVGVFPGTGIGGGCVYMGQILRGKQHSCFEFGHVQVNPTGLPCGCGRFGCLETEASRLAISTAAAAAVFRGEAPHLQAAVGTDIAAIRSGTLATAIREGDKIIERIVHRAAKLTGRAIGDIVNLILPDVIVLGGGLVEAMPDLMLGGVSEGVAERAAGSYSKSYRIVAAKLEDDAGVRGAAAWAARQAAEELAAKH